MWNLNLNEDSPQGAIDHTLRGHTRAITDINFSAHHPDMLASCAMDGYVHCWDLRRSKAPVLSFCDWFAGATQVKYNRQDSHILASCHDRWLRIWDDRKGAAPLRSIDAHESKIYGIDWNRTRSTGIVTCSLDKTIKFWDYGNDEDVPERVIRTDFPIWRARHTPFGWGLLAMPQESPGQLHLYDRRSKTSIEDTAKTAAVKVFPGHGTYKVKEFLWRARGVVTDDGMDNRDFQLVSWGDDNKLRIHNVDPAILEGVGHVKGAQVRKRLTMTRQGAQYKTFRKVEKNSSEKKIATITGPRPGSSGVKVSALSTGMKKMHLPSSTRTHMMIKAPALKRKDKPSTGDLNQRQIGWMSGIKFSKPENDESSQKRPTSRRLSLLNPDLRDLEDDGDWDAPESLHDEIIRIHDKLPKITFDNVNMDKRTVEASMNGPWGVDGKAIYIHVTIHFPDQYPEKVPTFTLGKTSLMPDATYDRLKSEVHQVAVNHLPHKKGCLEGTLSYLLGEVDLEASTTLFTDVGDIDDLDGLADESSSDDEDENIPAGASAMLPQGLDSSANEDMLTMMSRNANVPMPRLCGARFSANGKLTCFFPPKEDKVKSLLGTLVARNSARLKGEPMFESFGRLHNNSSPVPKMQTLSTGSELKDESDFSDDSEVSSSSDSDSTQFHVARFPVADYFRRSTRRSYMRASSAILSQKSSAGGTNTNTGTGTGTGFSRSRTKPKNSVVIHDISHLLPSKIKLAEEYAIFGDGPDVCEHNATVAADQGFRDLADVWKYVAMLLHNEVPLEVLDQNHRTEPILVIARNSVKRAQVDSGSDSGVDLSYEFGRDKSLSGRVKWGSNPLAVRVIQDLFSHFEQNADVQMLAMLSCVFREPSFQDVTSKPEVHMTQPQTPLSMKTPAFSLDYFPTDAAAWSMYQRTPIHSAATTPKTSHTPVGLYGSFGSSNGAAWSSDPASASYSCGETPPLRSNRTSSEYLNRQAHSLSTSPDNPRLFRRANSALASSFAASFSRPFTGVSSSPPSAPPPSRKRPSPVEHMLNSLSTSSAITWGNTTVLGSVKEQFVSDISNLENDNSREKKAPGTVIGISLTLDNQNAFDDEGCMTSPLLDPKQAMVFENYRKAYAELLYAWGHPLARLEILKFNGLQDYAEVDFPDNKSYVGSILSNSTHTMTHEPTPPSPIILGRKSAPQPPPVIEHGLDVTGYCLKHDRRLEPLVNSTAGGAVGRCERCKTIQRHLRCTICLEPISGVFTPCLSCGCVTHQHCLTDYHTYGNTDCPGGCDCDCGLKANDGVVESWEIMMSAIERLRALDAKNRVAASEKLDDWDSGGKDDWEHSDTGLTRVPSGASAGLGRGYSTLSQRLGRVRTGDWSMSGAKKKTSSLRNQEL